MQYNKQAGRVALATILCMGGLVCTGAAASRLVDNGAATLSPTNPEGNIFRATQTVLGGIGHQLIIPYFTVQAGNATLINLINTDNSNAKAVKIRFRGASNADSVLDFQVFLSPGDMWTANVSRGADGRAVLTTNDVSCTIPQTISGTAFSTSRVNPRLTGDALAAETREGYVEIINMADIPWLAIDVTGGPIGPGTPPFGRSLARPNPLYTAVKHVNRVAPCYSTPASADALNLLQNDPTTLGAAYALGLRAPSTGLTANWTIINVPQSGAATGEALALEVCNPYTGEPSRGAIVFFPQNNAAAATPDLFTADPTLRTSNVGPTGVQDGKGTPFAGLPLPMAVARNADLPDLSTLYVIGSPGNDPVYPLYQAEVLSKRLATLSVMNEYITDPSVNAQTDWVLSTPTRRYAVGLDYRTAAPGAFGVGYSRFVGRDYFGANINYSSSGQQLCSPAAPASYDREETIIYPTNFIPQPPTQPIRICGAVTVLAFNAVGADSTLGSTVTRINFSTTGLRDGWVQLNLITLSSGQGNFPAEFGTVDPPGGNGIPVLGRAFTRVGKGGLSANFGASWEHRYTRPVP